MSTFATYEPLWKLASRFAKPYRYRIAVGMILSVLVGLLGSVHFLVFSPALNLFTQSTTPPAESWNQVNLSNLGPTLLETIGVNPDHPSNIILFVTAAFFGVALLIAGLQTLTKVLVIKVRVSLIQDITHEVHGFLIRQPMQYFNERNVGDFLSRVSNDSKEAARGIDSSLTGILANLCHILLTTLVLAKTDALLTLAIFCLGGIHLLISKLLAPRLVRALSKNMSLKGSVNHLMMESFNGIRVIKTMAAERHMDRVIRDALDRWRKAFYDSAFLAAIDQPIRLLTDSLLTAAALTLTYWSMSSGRMTLDAAALYITLCLKLIPPTSQFASGLFMLGGSAAGSKRVMEILDADRVLEDGDKTPDPLATALTLQNIRFGYNEKSPVLDNLQLEIHRGESIALVGPSGSGKSTLADLLLRLYDPQQGAILYDGVDIRSFEQRAYRRRFGVVNQECLLFCGTVQSNILFGRPLDQSAYERAKEIANCHFIDELDEQDATRVGDRGITLSGGQRQRIALARAVYGKPDILILDEATSALDAESEQQVQLGIQQAVQHATAVIVAHRLSTVREADRIVVIDRGTILAIGTHEELLESNEVYRNLCNLQFLPEVQTVS